jgi:hypothetical protein
MRGYCQSEEEGAGPGGFRGCDLAASQSPSEHGHPSGDGGTAPLLVESDSHGVGSDEINRSCGRVLKSPQYPQVASL